jgi:hypothetical protein
VHNLSFLENGNNFEVTESVGGFMNAKAGTTFDDIFTEAVDDMRAQNIDPMVDINAMIKNQALMEVYKDSLLGTLKTECANWEAQDAEDPEHSCHGTHVKLYEQVSDMFDNCVNDLISESTRVGQLLPIKAVDLPILVKQQLKLATKDIMQTETVRTPIIKKHMEQTYIVDNNDPSKRWKFPQCFFDGTYREAWEAGKGFPIKNDVVPIDDIVNYNIIEKLTDVQNPESYREHITIALSVSKVMVADPDGGDDVELTLRTPLRINLSDQMVLGGEINQDVKRKDGTTFHVTDQIVGMADTALNTISLKCMQDKVKGVIFEGYISNELNERSVTFDYERKEVEWKIEDGSRANISYSLEELEDTKALMDIDLYRKSYNNLTEYMVQQEDSDILGWLDRKFEEYKGVELDILGFDPFILEDQFDCDSTSITTALPNEYISEMLKFKIDRIITDIADSAKLDGFTFVIYGNPRYISFLNPKVNWVTRPGNTINGVKLDYSYGIMTSGDVKVQVVSTKKVLAKYDGTHKMHKGLRIIPFPTSNEQFTFKHYKYTTHILTAQNSAYRDPNKPGGSMTNLMGVSRYTNACIQGIQAQLGIVNAEQYINMTYAH